MEKYEITYNLSSLEGRFTDFDQWIQSLQDFEKRSSQRKRATEKKHEETIDNTFIFKLQELHVEGIVTHTATQKQFLLKNNINDLRKNYYDYIYFDYILYKLLNNENNKKKFVYRYMTSKL